MAEPEAGEPRLFIVQRRQYRIWALEDAVSWADDTDTCRDLLRRYPKEVEPMRGAFACRADAEAFRAEHEEAARSSGNLRPLYAAVYPRGLECLLKLTEFDP